MAITKEERRLLSLNKRETEILKALDVIEAASIQDLADHLKIPRTSLYWPISQLSKRNLVGYTLVGKRKHWHSRMGELPLRKKLGSLKSVAGDVRVVEGIEQMQELYNTALDLHATERVLILEGNAAAHSVARKGGIEFMIAWHTRALKKKVIIESIWGEKVQSDLQQQIIDPRVVRSLSRWNTWIGHVVPDDWIDVDAALLLFRDVAILADWTQARAVLINTPEIVLLLRNLFEVFQLEGRKIDIVKIVRKVVAEN